MQAKRKFDKQLSCQQIWLVPKTGLKPRILSFLKTGWNFKNCLKLSSFSCTSFVSLLFLFSNLLISFNFWNCFHGGVGPSFRANRSGSALSCFLLFSLFFVLSLSLSSLSASSLAFLYFLSCSVSLCFPFLFLLLSSLPLFSSLLPAPVGVGLSVVSHSSDLPLLIFLSLPRICMSLSLLSLLPLLSLLCLTANPPFPTTFLQDDARLKLPFENLFSLAEDHWLLEHGTFRCAPFDAELQTKYLRERSKDPIGFRHSAKLSGDSAFSTSVALCCFLDSLLFLLIPCLGLQLFVSVCQLCMRSHLPLRWNVFLRCYARTLLCVWKSSTKQSKRKSRDKKKKRRRRHCCDCASQIHNATNKKCSNSRSSTSRDEEQWDLAQNGRRACFVFFLRVDFPLPLQVKQAEENLKESKSKEEGDVIRLLLRRADQPGENRGVEGKGAIKHPRGGHCELSWSGPGNVNFEERLRSQIDSPLLLSLARLVLCFFAPPRGIFCPLLSADLRSFPHSSMASLFCHFRCSFSLIIPLDFVVFH